MKNQKSKGLIAILISIIVLSGCHQSTKLTPGQGYINVPGGKVWYRVEGNGNKTPLLLLHGGPGVPSYYLNPLGALAKDRPVIFFDQLGCGRSHKITDTSLLTVQHFVDELEVVKQYFGLNEYYLLGQSWGTMLATDYYLQHPEGIKALIQCSPAISIPMWLADADTLIATMPDSIQQAIRVNEQNATYDSPDYIRAVKAYYEQYVARKLPWSKDLDSAFSQMGVNVYTYMGGPSEFTMTGPLKDYDQTKRLGEIKVPTLFLTGEFDEARPSTVKYYQSLVPGAKFALIRGAGHITMHDNADETNQAITDFLNELDKK